MQTDVLHKNLVQQKKEKNEKDLYIHIVGTGSLHSVHVDGTDSLHNIPGPET